MENGKTPTNVYVDLLKAFDALTFDVLLFKLKDYGVTDTAESSMLYLIVVNLTILKYILEYHRDPY